MTNLFKKAIILVLLLFAITLVFLARNEDVRNDFFARIGLFSREDPEVIEMNMPEIIGLEEDDQVEQEDSVNETEEQESLADVEEASNNDQFSLTDIEKQVNEIAAQVEIIQEKVNILIAISEIEKEINTLAEMVGEMSVNYEMESVN